MEKMNSRIPEQYDIKRMLHDLKQKEEMDPDSHDGSYRMMRETIKAYAGMRDLSVIDYRDLNLVYLTTVGTWKHGIGAKKATINESHLNAADKEHLKKLWDETWEKAGKGEFTNSDSTVTDKCSIGMFGTGFQSFQSKTTAWHARVFIEMCIDILPMKDDNEMFNRAERVFTDSFKGMQAASASMVLHCLKPFTFPIMNTNMGRKNVFELMGVRLDRYYYLDEYIKNCRKIKAFRDENFSFGNYRIFDMAAKDVDKYLLTGKTGDSDIQEHADADKETDENECFEMQVSERVREEFRRQIQAKKAELDQLNMKRDKLQQEIALLQEMLRKV